eukprot:5659401-Pleurochrysis_carterae.AAC.1
MNVREKLGTVIFMWIPSHVGIIPNVFADNLAAQEQENAPEGMITGLVSKQVKSRPLIYNRKVKGIAELADTPIYEEARRRGKKFIRESHKPPEEGDKCERYVARGLIDGGETEEEEEDDTELDIERQEGKREVEKFVHGLRNGEIVGSPAKERRMRHATREGNRPSFWIYLQVNGCRGCQRQEEEETIQHVLSGVCEGIGKSKNNRYRIEMRGIIEKCGKLMSDVNNREGTEQAAKVLRALEWPRRQVDQRLKEEEELALKQIIAGIIPEWHD